MSQLERIGVSLDKELLSKFDKLIDKQGYQSRSEALRDLVRRQLSEERLSDPKAKGVAAVRPSISRPARSAMITPCSENLAVSN